MLDGDNGQTIRRFLILMTKSIIKENTLDKYLLSYKMNIRK